MNISPSPTFLSEDFLLLNETARDLYHHYAADLPIIDFHNHLSPQAIADDRKYKSLTELWLHGDHYKWRAMRTYGIDESFITGNASDEEKFKKWAEVVPHTLRNPLFHWTHLELKNTFGVDDFLKPSTAERIYRHCNARLERDSYSTQGLLAPYKVEALATTDDPCDDLSAHQQLAQDNFSTQVLPGFRPDRLLNPQAPGYKAYIQDLERATGMSINSFSSLLAAVENRIDYFHQHGCRISDHGLTQIPATYRFDAAMEADFNTWLNQNTDQGFAHPNAFAGRMLVELGKLYHAKDWVQQFHLGALRNTNTRLFTRLGADSGFDTIGNGLDIASIAAFLNVLESSDQLAKTILYNLNPTDNEALAALVGNFQQAPIRGKVQYGAAWWFLDQQNGMEKQMDALSNMSLLSGFVGMLTDSRSFLSFSRHEYFRRILCNLLGREMEQGLLPNDLPWIGKMVQDICYYNAKNYFRFND